MELSEKIYKLRSSKNLTQEKFAEYFGVSKQSVQKWEAGTAKPDIGNIVKIAKYFDISLDLLLSEPEARSFDTPPANKIECNYESFPFGHPYSTKLNTEYVQSYEEGKDIEKYEELFSGVKNMPDSPYKDKMADALFEFMTTLPTREGYEYVEPSDIESIRLCREGYEKRERTLSKRAYADKLKGAWTGRIAGCMLGKAVEGIRTDELIPFLKETGNYPLHRYITKADASPEVTEKYTFNFDKHAFVDRSKCAAADDDTNYTVMAQYIIKKYGRDFTAGNVGEAWIELQPRTAYFTAERVAFDNLVNGYMPPNTAIYKNPFREWIGAQIRADYYGYVNPGDPEAAADMAFRDASLSHIKNGIYGAMFVAGMLACASVAKSVTEVINGGLSVIPTKSRLHEAIRKVIGMYEGGKSREACFRYIHAEYDEHSDHGWCHTIPNAMIVAASLLYGDGDYGKSICMAVETGFDTDCNGATVGSVFGMLNGISAIGREWTEPLHNKLETTLIGHTDMAIDSLYELTMPDVKWE